MVTTYDFYAVTKQEIKCLATGKFQTPPEWYKCIDRKTREGN